MSPSWRRKVWAWTPGLLVAVALVTIAYVRPLLIAPVVLLLAVILFRAGFTAIESIVVAVIIGTLVFLLQPGIHVHHRSRDERSGSEPPNLALQRTPAATAVLLSVSAQGAAGSAELWR